VQHLCTAHRCSLSPDVLWAAVAAPRAEQLFLLCAPDQLEDADAIEAVRQSFEVKMSLETFQKLVYIWQCNSFCREGQRGRELFLAPAFCDHSCRPSCHFHRQEGTFQLFSARCVEPAEDLTISYLQEESLALSCRDRRELLAVSWSFLCFCTRCQDEFPMPLCCGAPCEGRITENIPSPGACGSCHLDLEIQSYFFECAACGSCFCPW
ncbi:unnamed protein product, partial [Effrenium voratum]